MLKTRFLEIRNMQGVAHAIWCRSNIKCTRIKPNLINFAQNKGHGLAGGDEGKQEPEGEANPEHQELSMMALRTDASSSQTDEVWRCWLFLSSMLA